MGGDKFIPETHLKQSTALGKPRFMYNACGPFTKNKEIVQNFKETGDTKYIYKNRPWFINILIKNLLLQAQVNLQAVVLNLCQISYNLQMNVIIELLESL